MAKSQSPLKIIGFQAENFKRIQCVEIAPDGNVVEIKGKNGQGKTSVLDAIWVAIAGAAVAPEKAIRKGEKQAIIRLDMGEIVVTRKFKLKQNKDGKEEETTEVIVESDEGARFGKPQQMLDELFDHLAIDPSAFERMDARAQFNALRKFVPDVDFEQIAMLARGDREKRTEINRDLERVKKAAEAIDIDVSKGLPARVDEAALTEQLANAAGFNSAIEARKLARQSASEEIARLQARVAELQARIDGYADDKAAALKKAHDDYLERVEEIETTIARSIASQQDGIKSAQESAASLQKKLDEAEELPAPIDTAAVSLALTNARTTNSVADQAKRKVDFLAEAETLQAESDKITKRLEDREASKRAAIAKAKLPVEGLSFGEDEILLNDVPFSQASDAERLRVSCALAMQTDKRLKIVRVREGSRFDEDSMKLIADMAAEHGAQVWIETVGTKGKTGFVMEDGHARKASEE